MNDRLARARIGGRLPLLPNFIIRARRLFVRRAAPGLRWWEADLTYRRSGRGLAGSWETRPGLGAREDLRKRRLVS